MPLIAWLAVLASTAAAAPKLDTELISDVYSNGTLHAALLLTNHSDRNVCFLPGKNKVAAWTKDGPSVDYEKNDPEFLPDDVQVAWNDGRQHRFELEFNFVGMTVGPGPLPLTKVTFHFEAYDCAELFSHELNAPIQFRRDLSAIPRRSP